MTLTAQYRLGGGAIRLIVSQTHDSTNLSSSLELASLITILMSRLPVARFISVQIASLCRSRETPIYYERAGILQVPEHISQVFSSFLAFAYYGTAPTLKVIML
jgi:hypothetical protein